MTKARFQFDDGYVGKYLGEAIGATRKRLEGELEASSGVVKRETVDPEGIAYFKERIAGLKLAMRELSVIEAEAMRAGAAAFKINSTKEAKGKA